MYRRTAFVPQSAQLSGHLLAKKTQKQATESQQRLSIQGTTASSECLISVHTRRASTSRLSSLFDQPPRRPEIPSPGRSTRERLRSVRGNNWVIPPGSWWPLRLWWRGRNAAPIPGTVPSLVRVINEIRRWRHAIKDEAGEQSWSTCSRVVYPLHCFRSCDFWPRTSPSFSSVLQSVSKNFFNDSNICFSTTRGRRNASHNAVRTFL